LTNENVLIEMIMTINIKGRMILYRESPLDFKAVNSLFSAKLPKVIKEESRMASGTAKGTRFAEA
jgi:hypothetical protein